VKLRIILLLAALVAALGTAAAATAPALAAGASSNDDQPHVVLFWAEGCPYCEAELEFLADLADRMPQVRIADFEVRDSEANRAHFTELLAALGMEPQAVPTTIVGDRVWVGFDERRASEIEAAVAALLAGEPVDDRPAANIVDLPLVGEVDVGSHSLLIATLAIGFVDGFNPCSLWALSMLLALVLHTGSRRRVLLVGLVFLSVTTAMYGLYMWGLYGVLSYVGFVGWIRVAVALVALAMGIVNVKDYFAFGVGPSLTISATRKPGLLARMRTIASSDRPLPPLLAGTATLAVGVSLLETPCTAGFPILWTNLLADHGVGAAGAVALFSLYMVVFLLDELAIFGGAVVAMRVSKVGEGQGRLLKLVGGSTMIAIAGTLVFAPQAMESMTGVVVVFGAAVVATVLTITIHRLATRKAADGSGAQQLSKTATKT
jgi:thiol-disulfide isomerase/thioredoxin